VTCRELINLTISRVTRIRRVNLAIVLCLPLVLSALAWLLASAGYIPRPFELPLFGFIVLLGFLFFDQSRELFSAASPDDAAKTIDEATQAKERFLTLASVQSESNTDGSANPQLSLIEKQSEAFVERFDLKTSVPLTLTSTAKVSLLASPILLGIFLFLLVLQPSAAFAPSIAELNRSAEYADEIRELLENTPELPTPIRDDLEELAELIEEEGAFSDVAFEQIDQSIDSVAEFESDLSPDSVAENEVEPPSSEPSPEPEPPEPEQADTQDTPESEAPEDTGSEEQEEQGEESATEKQKSEDPSKQMEKGGSEEKQGDSASPDQESSQGKQQDPDKKGEKNADESGKGKQQADDPKKDVTGVGEGKGKGKSGEKKEQQGESQQGNDASGAKKGGAENQSDSGGEKGQKKGEKKKPGESGKKKSAGEKSQGKKKGGEKKGPGKGQKEAESLSKAKKKLEDIKKDMQKKGKGEGKGEGGKKGEKKGGSGEKPQSQAGKSKQDSKNKKQGQTQGAPSDSGKKPGEGKKPGDKNAGTPQAKDSAGKTKEKGKGEGKGESEGKGGKGTKGSQKGNNLPPESLKKDPSKKPTDVAKANQKARRYGPFGGGKDGAGNKAKIDNVQVPQGEEKIIVRSLGSTDNKKYKNQSGANAKTKLGSDEFTKPQSDVPESKQPIPVEYGDILR